MKKYFKNYLLFLLFLTCSSVMADSTSTVAIGLTIDSTVVMAESQSFGRRIDDVVIEPGLNYMLLKFRETTKSGKWLEFKGEIGAFSIKDSKLLWTYPFNYGNSSVYCTKAGVAISKGNKFCMLDPNTGHVRWQGKFFPVQYDDSTNIVLGYSGPRSSKLSGYDMITGQQLWTTRIPHDKNKGIVKVGYDYGGMPRRVQFSNGCVAEYAYAADGRKLRTVHRTAVSGITATDVHVLTASETAAVDSTLYVGGFRISNLNGGIKYHYGNGYLTCSRAGKVTPYFYVRDHLGSVRAALTQTGAVRQITNYYAYGTFMGDVSKGYVIKTDRYTGKELDREAGLDLYDYGARQYDATVGLFTSMDPMCEQYYHLNPYLYCAGNPVRYVDPDGNSIWTKVAKGFVRVGRRVIKNGASALTQADTYLSTVSDFTDAYNTLTDANTSTGEKVLAGLSLASEFLPVSVGDVKDAGKVVKKVASSIRPNGGIASPHGGKVHNDKIDKLIKILRNDKNVRNIRKNQKQVDIKGNVIGNNRPDIQFDKNGIHTNVEYDTKQSSSDKHKKIIDTNDPDARNKYYRINK